MAEPRDTTDERWTWDDQIALQNLGVKDSFHQQIGGLIGAVPNTSNSVFRWTSDKEELFARAQQHLKDHPDSAVVQKLFAMLLAQKLRTP